MAEIKTNNDGIKQQVEFYFSESNLRKDKFLISAIESNEKKFVPIATLLTFNKLKALTTVISEVSEALVGSDLVEVSEDGLNVRRASDLPESDTSRARTLYVKGYPLEDTSITIESVCAEFKHHGNINMVRLRKEPTSKTFKGSCFIEFDNEESVAKAVASAHGEDGLVTLSYKETPFLCVMTLNHWLTNKENKKLKLAERKKAAALSKAEGLKRGRDDDSKEDNKKVKNDAGEAVKKLEFTPGLILKINNVAADASLYKMKEFFKEMGDVKFVEYTAGETDCTLRCGSGEGAADIIAKIAVGVTFEGCDKPLVGSIVSGDDETEFYSKMKKASDNKGNGGRGGGRGGKGRGGGRGGGKGRGGRR
jgi:lupus La protein